MLAQRYGLRVKEYPDRIVLNYDMVDSHTKRFEPIVMECRGLILRLGTWDVLCRSFDRFFNYGEDPKTKQFPIDKSTTFEKVDGTLFNVYHDGDDWQVATRRQAFAEELTIKENTWKSVFEKGLGKTVREAFATADPNCTYIHEGVSPETRVVTPYSEYQVYLLAARRSSDGRWVEQTECDSIARSVGTRRPGTFSFKSYEDIEFSARNLPAVEEGYVCLGPDNWRIKIKNPSYVAIAHLRGMKGVSSRNIIRLIWAQDLDEYLSYFPEDKDFTEAFEKAYEVMLGQIKKTHKLAEGIIRDHGGELTRTSRKKVAREIKYLPESKIVFKMIDGKSFPEIIERMPFKQKEALLKKFVD